MKTYMVQPEGFMEKGLGKKVCLLQRSIYRLKQASRSWNIRVDQTFKSYGYDQVVDELCVYGNLCSWHSTHWKWYERNDNYKVWLTKKFDIKDFFEQIYVLGIQIIYDRKNRLTIVPRIIYR